jgi:hypothetical protein
VIGIMSQTSKTRVCVENEIAGDDMIMMMMTTMMVRR